MLQHDLITGKPMLLAPQCGGSQPAEPSEKGIIEVKWTPITAGAEEQTAYVNSQNARLLVDYSWNESDSDHVRLTYYLQFQEVAGKVSDTGRQVRDAKPGRWANIIVKRVMPTTSPSSIDTWVEAPVSADLAPETENSYYLAVVNAFGQARLVGGLALTGSVRGRTSGFDAFAYSVGEGLSATSIDNFCSFSPTTGGGGAHIELTAYTNMRALLWPEDALQVGGEDHPSSVPMILRTRYQGRLQVSATRAPWPTV